MKIIIFFTTLFFILLLNSDQSFSQEGKYKIGKKTWIIEKTGKKLIIYENKNDYVWILSMPDYIEGKIVYGAINDGEIIDFYLEFNSDNFENGIMERKYGLPPLKIKKLN